MDYPKAYLQYATQMDKFEVINGSLWDTLTYTSGATLRLTYFTATRATIDLSNLEVAGQLPYPKAFLVRSMKVFLKQRPESVNSVAATAVQTGAINNVVGLFDTGAVTINVGSKNYGIYPLWVFGCAGGPSGFMAQTNILIAGSYADYGQSGLPHSKAGFTFSVPLFIEPQMNFNVDIQWAAAVTLTRNLTLCVSLEGDLIRPVQ
jgi:hypothetical protein